MLALSLHFRRLFVTLLLLTLVADSALGDPPNMYHVDGYFRKDGTYVSGHYKHFPLTSPQYIESQDRLRAESVQKLRDKGYNEKEISFITRPATMVEMERAAKTFAEKADAALALVKAQESERDAKALKSKTEGEEIDRLLAMVPERIRYFFKSKAELQAYLAASRAEQLRWFPATLPARTTKTP